MSNVKFTEETVNKMFELYKQGKRQREIATAFSTTQDRVSSLFKKYDMKVEHNNSRYFNIGLYKEYFDRIDSPDKAYFLGFMITDGNVRLGGYGQLRLQINSRDRYILEIFNFYTKNKNKIVDSCVKKENIYKSTFLICSVYMINSIAKYGVVPNKTFKTFLPILSEDMMPHLIRGLIDGDGWISTVNHGVGICGSERLVNDVRTFLVERLGVTMNTITKDHNIYKVSWQNPTDFAKICGYIYENKGDCYLIRKYLNFIEVMKYFLNRPFRIPVKKIRVRQFTLNGEFVKEYDNNVEAGKLLSISHQNILLCCKKSIRSCGGFIFRFNLSDYFANVPEKYRDKKLAFSESV